ncbi:amidohydrolase [Bacillus cereus]|uniref:DUF3800 domain-containing protein n=1 Tax=Bacillus cereus group TaxID=86661 RepID=UPI001F31EF33|nr:MULTISPECIES: DUF3800 domain-containing protein [Bacillus cereus group]BCB39509.1 amidohydrolase [Bacillus cereus]BCC02350.1 amidohydrolase [Bacillus cereus]BCC25862.1 amidohydrolase [Bacillus cereus]BCC37430.1 amidohydrolase [Bacillus cereus]BCC43232.1 amidohydrolase [Bacillus cereus]
MSRKKKKYILFIDETGISQSSTEPFTLTGVIFENKYAVNQEGDLSELHKKINVLKQQCFGTEDVLLHLDHISRGKGEFSSFTPAQRAGFYHRLPNFLAGLDFKIISVTVDKSKLRQYFQAHKDPYVVAFIHILETFYSFLSQSHVENARIVLESRDDFENLLIQKAFFEVFNNGTMHLDFQGYREKIKGFILAKKGDSLYQSGLEIADLICNPISRVRKGVIEARPRCMSNYGNENKIFKSIKTKIYSPSDEKDIRNWGFKKIPITKKKRDWIDDPKSNDEATGA